MKISVFPTILLIIATIAIGYFTYDLAHSRSDANDMIVGIGTGVSGLITLGCVMGLSLKDERLNVNMKAWSFVAFVIMVAVNICFAMLGAIMPTYIIVISLLMVIHLWVVYKMAAN